MAKAEKRLLQVVTGTFPCGQQMLKYGYKRTAECTPCKKVHEESGSSWNRELPKETIGHIQSAGCLGQKEVVTAAHTACIWMLQQEVDVHGKADRHETPNDCDRKQVGYTLGSRTVYANCGKQRKRRK
jgi:hypothetical protein